jgi:hypothetical protein
MAMPRTNNEFVTFNMKKTAKGKPARSGNIKTGEIFVLSTSSNSCPTTCAFYEACYAASGNSRMHWQYTDRQLAQGADWALAMIRQFKKGELWRLNETGDLPHDNGTIDAEFVAKLANAQKGMRGFTYTHHVLSPENIATLQSAKRDGFTVNVSCETMAQADRALALGLPAVIVLPRGKVAKGATTPGGNPIRQCPATLEGSAIQCETCGICQRPDRKTIVGFPAHGASAKSVEAALTKANANPFHGMVL